MRGGKLTPLLSFFVPFSHAAALSLFVGRSIEEARVGTRRGWDSDNSGWYGGGMLE